MKFRVLTIFLLFLFISTTHQVFSQRVQKKSSGPAQMNEFLDKQMYLGIRGGFTLTKPLPVTRYSVFSSTDGTKEGYEKEYSGMNAPGPVAGIELTYTYYGFSLSFQPNYRRYRFSYENNYQWTDTSGQNNLDLKYEQEHQLDYIEFPLFVKYEFLKGSLKPFVQAGFYYSRLFNANKSLVISGKDKASGNNEFEDFPVIVSAEQLFIKSLMGYAAGIGASWDVGNIRLILDIVYRRNTHNITNANNRYTENQLAGSGDAMDDLKLRSITVNMACVFPMRFLNAKNFKTSK